MPDVPAVAILEKLAAHYKITPAYVKRILADNPENKWALAWRDVLDFLKEHKDRQIIEDDGPLPSEELAREETIMLTGKTPEELQAEENDGV